jgi:hypothetical protein
VLASTLSVSVESPCPAVGDTWTHEALLVALHVQSLAVDRLTLTWLALAGTDADDPDRVMSHRTGSGPVI